MASVTDIRLLISFRDSIKRSRLRRRLGSESIEALIDLWLWAANEKPEGDLTGLADVEIEEAARWRGPTGALIAALVEIRWLDGFSGGYLLHDWPEHQRWVAHAEERSKAARALADKRWKKDRGSAKTAKITQGKPALQGAMRAASEPQCQPQCQPQCSVSVSASVSASASVSKNKNARSARARDGSTSPRTPKEHDLDARTILGALNEARSRVNPKARGITATADNLKLIAARLESGATTDDCLHVISVLEAECKRDASVLRWFDSTTPFRPENFSRKVAALVGDAAESSPSEEGPLVPEVQAILDEMERQKDAKYAEYVAEHGEPPTPGDVKATIATLAAAKAIRH